MDQVLESFARFPAVHSAGRAEITHISGRMWNKMIQAMHTLRSQQ